MFEWIAGAAYPYAASTDQDVSCLQEPPETPAPLFAVRAFKTALFGTPATIHHTVNDDNRLAKIQHKAEEDLAVTFDRPILQEPAVLEVDMVKSKADMFAPPAKGILVTPGTITTRQKSVSFDPLAKMEQRSVERLTVDTMNSNASDESPCPNTTAKLTQSEHSRSASLSRKLFQERIGEKEKEGAPIPAKSHPTQTKVASAHHRYTRKNDEKDTDITIDLDDPRSRSGKHWKHEYSQYHNKSDYEMRKLIQYSQSTKSYAAKKHDDALDLESKLRNALSQLAESESRISELAARLAKTSRRGEGNSQDQEEARTHLATDVALAPRSKQKTEKYEAATRKNVATPQSKYRSKGHHREERMNEILPDKQKYHDSSDEISTLRSEVESLRVAVAEADENAAALEYQKAKLEENLIRVRKEMDSGTLRRKAKEESQRKTDEKRKELRRKLEAEIKRCRAEHGPRIEDLLQEKSMQDREINRLQKMTGNALDGEKNESFYEREALRNVHVEDLQRQIKELQEQAQILQPDILEQQQRKVSQELRQSREELRRLQVENSDLKDRLRLNTKEKTQPRDGDSQRQLSPDSVDIWADTAEPNYLPKDTLTSPVINGTTTNITRLPTGTACVLMDIDHNSTKKQLHGSDQKAFHNLSHQTHASQTHKPESTEFSSLLNRKSETLKIREHRHHKSTSNESSPRPSTSAFASKASKADIIPVRSYSPELSSNTHHVPRRRVTTTLIPSSRTGSLARGKSRSTALPSLPPERIAAAKARLQEKHRGARFQGQDRKGKERVAG